MAEFVKSLSSKSNKLCDRSQPVAGAVALLSVYLGKLLLLRRLSELYWRRLENGGLGLREQCAQLWLQLTH